MGAFIELTRAYLRSFMREPSAVIFSFAVPILFVFALGLLFGSTGVERFNVGIVGGDASATRLATSLGGIGILKVHRGSAQHELEQLHKGNRKAVVEFTADGALRLYANPSDDEAMKTVVPLVRQAIVAATTENGAAPQPSLVATKTQDSRYIDYLVPSILAMSLMQLGLYSAVTVATQRENKLLRRLSATPLPRATLVAAQVVQRVIMSAMQAVILIAIGRIFFSVDFTRNLPALLAFVVLGTLAFTALGFTVGAVAPTAESAMPIVQFIALPMLFLSGIFFPVDVGPSFLQAIVRLMPLTYLADAVRQSTVNAAAMVPLWIDAAILGGWLIVAFVLAVRLFRWE